MPTELFRFRTVRPVQNKQSGFSALPATPSSNLDCPNLLNTLKNEGIAALLGSYSKLQQVSQQLAANFDLVAPSTFIAMLPTGWIEQTTSDDWTKVVQTLTDTLGCLANEVKATAATSDNYGIPVVSSCVAEDVELVARILLVMNCTATLARDQKLLQSERELQSAQDVQTALAFNSVSLPKEHFRQTPSVLARAPGVTDLSIVNDEWNRYVLGEIANIVNVLPGETFDSRIKHMQEIVQAQSTTTTQTTTQTTENSQTTSNTLSAATTSDASLNIGANAQVQTSGTYGPTTIQTTVGGQVQSAQSSSQSTSHTTAVETVARAVKTVSQTITQIQSTVTTTKDTSDEEHKLQNTGSTVTVGLYRWLNEIHRVELVNYPNRLVLEFEIPEPGAWLRWALNNQPIQPYDNPDPGPFAVNNTYPWLSPMDANHPDANPLALQPTAITPAIASGLAARWGVQGLIAPPLMAITIGNSYLLQPQSNAAAVLNDNSITVPQGYVAQTWFLNAASIGGDDEGGHALQLRVAVGGYGVTFTLQNGGTSLLFWGTQSDMFVANNAPTNQTTVTAPTPGDAPPTGALPVGDINNGTVPIHVNANFLGGPKGSVGVTLNVGIQCAQIPAVDDSNNNGLPYVQWQISTFNTIANAYQNLLSAYKQERDQRQQNNQTPIIVGPQTLNASRAAVELKRLAIQNLLGQPFFGYDLLKIGVGGSSPPGAPSGVTSQPGEPWFDPQTTKASSPVIQFFEQVFEWEDIVYICYPYFWGGYSRWATNATWASADPIFDQFLSAGSVRLVVPARPGFEHAVNFFLYTSMIWSGKNPPGPSDPGYLSVADEIQSIQVGATDGTPVYPPWEITLPTTLLWASTDPTLPTNPNPTIGPPPPTPQATAIAVTSSINPTVYGQPVSFTALLSAASGLGTPSGQVIFLVDGIGTPDGPVTLDDTGKATSAPAASLSVGVHTITVNYLGNGTFATVEGSLPIQTVNEAAATVTVASSTNPSVYGQPVTLSATVSAVAPGAGTPAGQVDFSVDGKTRDGPVTLDGTGKASAAAIASMTPGTHTMAATYLGDGNFATISAQLSSPQTVNKSNSSVVVASSNNPSKANTSVTFTAVVTAVAPGVGIPTGQVNFQVDAGADSPVTLDSTGKANAAPITKLAKGTHTVSVNYVGDANFAPGSGTLTQTMS
jgi:hypothetical protein